MLAIATCPEAGRLCGTPAHLPALHDETGGCRLYFWGDSEADDAEANQDAELWAWVWGMRVDDGKRMR